MLLLFYFIVAMLFFASFTSHPAAVPSSAEMNDAMSAVGYDSSARSSPVVVLLRVEGEITEGTYIDISEGIEYAEKNGASAVLIELNTPGGVSDAMLKTTERILSARVPVVTYVAPKGAICASAGSLILLSGHIAAMSPGTTVGAAMPLKIGVGGVQEADEKTINFFAGHFRSIAIERGRNETQASRFVTDNDVLNEKEALERGIIDVIADDERDLMNKIDGMVVRVGGENITLNTKNAIFYERERSLRSRIVDFLGNPQIAVVLLIIGIYGIIFGFMSPETYVPEMIGAICLILALYGMGLFNASVFGILLILFAVILLIAELLTPTFGILSTGAAVCLILGALLLPSEPFMLSGSIFEGFLIAVIGVGIASAGFFIFAAVKIINIRRRKPKVGPDEGLIGKVAEAITDINEKGMVKVRGEIWKAKTEGGEHVREGEKVEIVGREGLTLVVKRIDEKH